MSYINKIGASLISENAPFEYKHSKDGRKLNRSNIKDVKKMLVICFKEVYNLDNSKKDSFKRVF